LLKEASKVGLPLPTEPGEPSKNCFLRPQSKEILEKKVYPAVNFWSKVYELYCLEGGRSWLVGVAKLYSFPKEKAKGKTREHTFTKRGRGVYSTRTQRNDRFVTIIKGGTTGGLETCSSVLGKSGDGESGEAISFWIGT